MYEFINKQSQLSARKEKTIMVEKVFLKWCLHLIYNNIVLNAITISE